jgi:hypothetical protein
VGRGEGHGRGSWATGAGAAQGSPPPLDTCAPAGMGGRCERGARGLQRRAWLGPLLFRGCRGLCVLRQSGCARLGLCSRLM